MNYYFIKSLRAEIWLVILYPCSGQNTCIQIVSLIAKISTEKGYFVIFLIDLDHNMPSRCHGCDVRGGGCCGADDIFKCIFMNENAWISLKISLKIDPKIQINNIPALVQIMAWHRPGDKPLSELTMVSLLMHICVTRPQWLKTVKMTKWCNFLWIVSHETCGSKNGICKDCVDKILQSLCVLWDFCRLCKEIRLYILWNFRRFFALFSWINLSVFT